jgi:hypothetical protein
MPPVSKRTKSRRGEPDSKKKGKLLEEIVRRIHQALDPSADVQTNVTLPPIRTRRKRRKNPEIDVLIRQDVVGYPVQIAFECKNERDPVGIGRIREFAFKLGEVGIPVRQGIFVSPIGYTSDAEDLAAEEGIRLLTLEGLDDSRLRAVINEVMLGMVHYVLFVPDYTVFPYLPRIAEEHGEDWPADVPINPATLNDRIFRDWVTRGTPPKLGVAYRNFTRHHDGAIVSTRIVAYVARVPGTASYFTLTNASTKEIERSYLEATFRIPNSVELDVIESDEQLLEWEKVIEARTGSILHRILVPRIVAGVVFWPPSAEAIAKISKLRSAGETISFATVEGRDLSRAWQSAEKRARGSSQD